MTGNILLNGANINDKSRSIATEFIKIVDFILNFLVTSSILVACTGFFQTLGGYILLDISPNVNCCFAAFLMTFSVYSLNKLTDMKEDAINRPERISFLNGRRELILYYSIIAFILSLLLVYVTHPIALPILFIPLIANAIYGSKLLPGLPRLKDIPVIKNITVGVCWALVCILMPASSSEKPMASAIGLMIFLMIIKDFINSTLCDIKDIKGDKKSGIRTIPVVYGAQKTRLLLLALNCTLLPILYFVQGRILLLVLMMIASGFIFILSFGENSNPRVLEFFVDGEWLIFGIILVGFINNPLLKLTF